MREILWQYSLVASYVFLGACLLILPFWVVIGLCGRAIAWAMGRHGWLRWGRLLLSRRFYILFFLGVLLCSIVLVSQLGLGIHIPSWQTLSWHTLGLGLKFLLLVLVFMFFFFAGSRNILWLRSYFLSHEINRCSRQLLRQWDSTAMQIWLGALIEKGKPAEHAYVLRRLSTEQVNELSGIHEVLLKIEDTETRAKACALLAEKAPDLMSPYIDLVVADTNPDTRQLALHLIDNLAVTEAKQELYKLLADPDAGVRERALEQSRRVFDNEEWREMLLDIDSNRRMCSITAIAEAKYRPAGFELRTLLNHHEPRIVAAAAYALVQLDDEESVPLLYNLLIRSSREDLTLICLSMMGKKAYLPALPIIVNMYFVLGKNSTELKSALLDTLDVYGAGAKDELTKVVQNQNLSTAKREIAAHKLRKMRLPDLIPFFVQMVSMPEQKLRLAGVMGLSELTDHYDYLPELTNLLKDREGSVVGAALGLLTKKPDIRMLSSVLVLWKKQYEWWKSLDVNTNAKIMARRDLVEIEALLHRLHDLNQKNFVQGMLVRCTACYTSVMQKNEAGLKWFYCRKCGQADNLLAPLDSVEGHIGGGIDVGTLPGQYTYRLQLWENGQARNADITRLVVHPIARVDWAVSAVVAALENDATRKEPLRPTVRLMAGVELQPNTIKLLQDTGWQLEN